MNKQKFKKILLNFLKYFIFFGAGILLFLWVYRGQNPGQILDGLSSFKLGWILATFVAVIFSHLFRAMRWRMLIEPIGYKPGLMNTFLSILVMYLANYALPRMGEVTRCGILKKYEGIPFTSLLGTVLVERIVDVIFLLIILVSVLLVDWNMLAGFFHPEESGFIRKDFSLPGPVILIVAVSILAGLILLIWIFRKQLIKKAFVQKLMGLFAKFADGLRTVFKLKHPFIFILLTVGIYGCYFLMTFFIIKGFEPTANISPMVALAVLVMGSVGMVLPVQGGIGTYHFFALETLVMYGVSRPDGQLLTFVLYGATTMFIIIIGAFALGLLPVFNRKPNVNVVSG